MNDKQHIELSVSSIVDWCNYIILNLGEDDSYNETLTEEISFQIKLISGRLEAYSRNLRENRKKEAI